MRLTMVFMVLMLSYCSTAPQSQSIILNNPQTMEDRFLANIARRNIFTEGGTGALTLVGVTGLDGRTIRGEDSFRPLGTATLERVINANSAVYVGALPDIVRQPEMTITFGNTLNEGTALLDPGDIPGAGAPRVEQIVISNRI